MNKNQKKKQNKNKNKKNQVRGNLARDPGSRPGSNALSLTHSQFTATSPLNLFTVAPSSSPGGIRVSGRELVSAVTIPIATGVWVLSTAFDGPLPAFSLIAPQVFSRLSAYVGIYEYFIFHKLSYFFMSNQPTTATGEVIMSVDYDPTDPVPTSTAGQMRNISSTMANIYSDCSLQVVKSLSRLPKYECSTGLAEPLQQAQGVLYVAVEGYVNASASVVGYIVAQYDVEFFTPQ